jgi:SP family general alpha glucoside:H+ symporter-like MFS transporter
LQAIVFFGVAMQGVSLGIVRAFILDMRPLAWKIVFGIQWVFAGLVLIAAFLVPECVPLLPHHVWMRRN